MSDYCFTSRQGGVVADCGITGYVIRIRICLYVDTGSTVCHVCMYVCTGMYVCMYEHVLYSNMFIGTVCSCESPSHCLIIL